MDALTVFGLFAVTAMLVTYALEDRSAWFVLAFAAACVLGSIYGFLQGAWPFGVRARAVHLVWAAGIAESDGFKSRRGGKRRGFCGDHDFRHGRGQHVAGLASCCHGACGERRCACAYAGKTVMETRDAGDVRDHSARVSAVIVSYFTGPVLARAISALRAQSEISEIILIDNGNFPGDVEAAVGGEASCVKIVSGHGNIGFAAGCNLGARLATGEFLLIINPDAVMPDGGVARMLSDASVLERPWLMGAKLVGPDGVEQQGSRRRVLTPWTAFVEATRLYKLAPQHPYFKRFNMHSDECPSALTKVPTLSGAIMFLPSEDYAAVGGMDERYFLHVEDVDFCLRYAKAGGGVYFNPHISVLHFKSSSRASPVKIEARKTAGMIKYFHTHFSDAYPKPFLWLVDGALWTLFGALFVKRGFQKALRLAGFGIRSGGRGIERARALGRRRSGR